MRILVIEDNLRVNHALKLCLIDEGYAVDAAHDGLEGQAYAESTDYDAIVLDVMLPEKDGLEVCRALRRRRVNTPIMMLTARDAVDDRVRGLDSGADDYLVKPFALAEFHARLRALLRREAARKEGVLTVGDLTLDPAAHEVARAGRPIDLTAKEYAVLEFFVRHPNQIITRELVETHIWSYDFSGASNVVDVYVRRLRRKIDDGHAVKLLHTVRGLGYRLREPDQA